MKYAMLDEKIHCETAEFRTFSLVRFQLERGAGKLAVSSFTQPEGLLEIGLCLHGKWGFALPDQNPVAVTGSVGMVHLPGSSWQSRFETNIACLGIGIAISLEHLTWLVGDSSRVRKDVLALVAGRTRELAHFSTANPVVLSLATAIHTCEWDDPLQKLLVEAKSMELLYHVLLGSCVVSGQATHVSREDERKLRLAREMILADLENTITISDLSREVGLSPSKLKSSFKKHFGTTIHDFTRQTKLEHAKRMIESGDMNVTEAALSVGYNSLGHFSRIFKDTFGVLPKQAGKRQTVFPGAPVTTAA